MIRNLIKNAALALVAGLFLLFVAVQGWSLLQNFVGAPEPGHESSTSDLYANLSPEEVGRAVFEKQGCMGCHNLDLRGGVIGPSLNNFGGRWRGNPEVLKAKLTNPQAAIPNSYMPSFAHLSDEELDGVVAFLMSLKADRLGPDNEGEATIEIPVELDAAGNEQPKYSQDTTGRGRELFSSSGCIGCHAINGIAAGGAIGPNLTHESLRNRTDEWQLEHLKQPYSVYVLGSADQVACSRSMTCMPGYARLSQEDLQALVAFLQSLK